VDPASRGTPLSAPRQEVIEVKESGSVM
jgi:hypothetical protein